MITSRRSFLTGLGAALITVPAIVRAGSLMPVKQMIEAPPPFPFWAIGRAGFVNPISAELLSALPFPDRTGAQALAYLQKQGLAT